MADISRAPRAVVRTPGVVGGLARMDGTRIPVWQLVELVRGGMSPEEIVSEFDGAEFDESDIGVALAYAQLHIREIQRDIQDQDLEAID